MYFESLILENGIECLLLIHDEGAMLMTKQEIFQLINENPSFHLATVEGNQPRVRGMLLFRADENGLIFHTASTKDVYDQMSKNPKAEMCFFGNGTQVSVTGTLEQIHDEALQSNYLDDGNEL